MYDHTPLLIVEDDKTLAQVVDRLSEANVIGVDTESDSMYHYQEKVCLVQLTDAHGDIIIDPLKVKDLSPLKPIFADPEVVKIYHGADYDVISLHRDFELESINIFDTLIAAQFLGFDRLGLADLIGRYFGVPIDKQYQRHDWSRRPLLPEHLDYARGDTHWLLAIRELLNRELTAAGRLEHMAEECKLLEERRWTPREFDELGYLRIKKTSGLDDAAKRVLRRLYLYRDDEARHLDRPSYKVIGDSLMVQIAQAKPTTREALDKLFPRKHTMKRRYGEGIIESVREGLEDDFPIPETPKKNRDNDPVIKPTVTGRAAERITTALKDWRNDLVEGDGRYTPFSVASNTALKNIAQVYPTTLEALAAIPGIRAWQVRDHGEAILQVLADNPPPKRMVKKVEKPVKKKPRRKAKAKAKAKAEPKAD